MMSRTARISSLRPVEGHRAGARTVQGRFAGLEAGRGLAALAVALAHASMFAAQDLSRAGVVDTNAALPLGGRLANLVCGVDFFFVLSGFIITFVHWKDLGQPHRLRNYVAQRFTRIYPAYWIIVVPLILAIRLFPGSSSTYLPSPSADLASVLLVATPAGPALGVAWTLTHEILFYALFAIAIVSRRVGLIMLSVWTTVIVANLLLGVTAYPVGFLISSYNLEFILGVALAILFVSARIPRPGLVLALGLIGVGAGLCVPPEYVSEDAWARFHLYFAAFSVLIIAGLIELERGGQLRLSGFACSWARSRTRFTWSTPRWRRMSRRPFTCCG